MPKKETYDASSISVLEGLEAVRKQMCIRDRANLATRQVKSS